MKKKKTSPKNKRPQSRPIEPGELPVGREEERRGHDLPHEAEADEAPIGSDERTRVKHGPRNTPRP